MGPFYLDTQYIIWKYETFVGGAGGEGREAEDGALHTDWQTDTKTVAISNNIFFNLIESNCNNLMDNFIFFFIRKIENLT